MLYPKKKIVRTCVFKVAADSKFSIFTYASVRSSIEVCSEVIVSNFIGVKFDILNMIQCFILDAWELGAASSKIRVQPIT